MRSLKALALACLIVLPSSAMAETVITVSTATELSAALGSVPTGGVIELLPGTYAGGFVVSSTTRQFTLRATPWTAFLDGEGVRPVFKISGNGWIAFEGLNFQNGYSVAVNSESGGVTLVGGRATFVDCVFANNASAAPSGQVGGGGGVGLITGSRAMFIRCLWSGNTSKSEGGGMLVIGQSEAFIHDSQFVGNRTNVPGHKTTSGGGAINVWNSTVRVTNTRFESNEAGFTGGAIDAASQWTDVGTDVMASNCTFVGNVAEADPLVTPPSQTEGGAIGVENLATVKLYNCRLESNTAQVGGALSTYRGIFEVESSVFRYNRAVGNGTYAGGWGGTVYAASLDTAADGTSNRRPASVTIRDSVLRGSGATAVDAEIGGCVFIQGDTNRMYGQGGVTQMGTSADNRAVLDVSQSVLHECHADQVVNVGASGGGLYAALVGVTIDTSSFIEDNAGGASGWGGAVSALTESALTLTGTLLAGNSATMQGGALDVIGSALTVSGCVFIGNEVVDGGGFLGASLFASPYDSLNKDVTGRVENSLFSLDAGLPIFDDDRSTGNNTNEVQYYNNWFYNTAFGGIFATPLYLGGTPLPPAGAVSLNSLVVTHADGSTDKAPDDDNASAGGPGSPPTYGSLVAVPPARLTRTASGDSATTTESFLAYAWSGSSATLDGGSLSTHYGVTAATIGTHTLIVGTQSIPVSVGWGALPTATLFASPDVISGGQSSILEWTTLAGTALDSMVDWGVDTAGAASGAVSVTPPGTRTYRLLVATKEGGALATETIYVDELPPGDIFADGFESGSTSAWSAAVP